MRSYMIWDRSVSDTTTYCIEMLDAVLEASSDPELAYTARIRLRRALLALDRGQLTSEGPAQLIAVPPDDIRGLVDGLRERVLNLCQPSEALTGRWEDEWLGVEADLHRVREWLARCRREPTA